jgi:hypothetical protein
MLACALGLLAAVVALFGCGTQAPASSAVPPPVMPPPVDLKTPGSAVRSYLAWTTLAYRMANSDAASLTTTPMYGVHIDSYIELNREQGNKGIDQTLTRFVVRSESKEGTRAVVAAKEDWVYRYFSLSDQRYTSPRYTVSYDTTYTLVRSQAGWQVDDVQATPLTPVK